MFSVCLLSLACRWVSPPLLSNSLLCLSLFYFFMFSMPLSSLLHCSSLLLNIWLWAHWDDTTVPRCSRGCLDLKAEDGKRNMRHFQTSIWAFSVSFNLVLQCQSDQSEVFLILYIKKGRVPEHIRGIRPPRTFNLGRTVVDVASSETICTSY